MRCSTRYQRSVSHVKGSVSRARPVAQGTDEELIGARVVGDVADVVRAGGAKRVGPLRPRERRALVVQRRPGAGAPAELEVIAEGEAAVSLGEGRGLEHRGSEDALERVGVAGLPGYERSVDQVPLGGVAVRLFPARGLQVVEGGALEALAHQGALRWVGAGVGRGARVRSRVEAGVVSVGLGVARRGAVGARVHREVRVHRRAAIHGRVGVLFRRAVGPHGRVRAASRNTALSGDETSAGGTASESAGQDRRDESGARCLGLPITTPHSTPEAWRSSPSGDTCPARDPRTLQALARTPSSGRACPSILAHAMCSDGRSLCPARRLVSTRRVQGPGGES